ncbi:MAG: hypothetical protein PUE66_08075 [Erysipelotrichaceae bacterium]|nr:hypothetical protein [Erysipelotrichaceae bacterium]
MSKRKKHNNNKQQAQISKKEAQMAVVRAFYIRNIDVMLERELGIKTSWWQKFLIKLVQKGIKRNESKHKN